MKPVNRPFDYTSAEDSRKPGYLAQRIKKYAQREREAKEQRERAEAEAAIKISPIKRESKS